MRAVIIGGTGHIGTYLVPRLVSLGYEVINVSRSKRGPYDQHRAWKEVTQAQMDRKAEENTGSFGKRIRALQPDIVIDLICFTLESARHLAEALRGEIQHYLFMSYQPQPSLCADMRKKWRTGLVRKQFCSLNIGMNGKKKSRMRKLQLLGITLLTAQIAAFQKQSGC